MPTIPLYTPNPAHPDASHSVLAPGGYERWYFDAESNDGRLLLVAIFAQGSPDHPDHPQYLRQHAAYLRRPTRRRPPVPADFACVSFALYDRTRPVVQYVRPVPRDSFHAPGDRLELMAPPDSITTEAGGFVRLRVGGADLLFRPSSHDPPRKTIPLGPPPVWPHHRTALLQPYASVEGTVGVNGGKPLEFLGRGFHDHHFGDRPMCHWLRCRVVGGERAVVFSAVEADRIGRGPLRRAFDARWTQVDAGGAAECVAQVLFDAARYPATLEVPGRLTLDRPAVLGRSGLVDRIVFEVSGPATWASGRHVALCEWC